MRSLSDAEFWYYDTQWYLLAVYQDAEGAFYTAKTRLWPGVWIVVDAFSAAEASQQMRMALAGAVWSRMYSAQDQGG
jgi:hypothetical protein